MSAVPHAASPVPPAGPVAPGAPGQPARKPLGRFAGVRLVAIREILVTVRSKAFIISLIVTMLLSVVVALAGGLLVPLLIGSPPKVAVTAETEPIVAASSAAGFTESGPGSFETLPPSTSEQAVQAVRDGTADVAVLPASAFSELSGTLHHPDGGEVTLAPGEEFFLLGDAEGSSAVSRALSDVPETFLLQAPDPGDWMGTVLPIVFGLLYFLVVMSYASAVSMSVVEEKATRVVEILLATLSPRTIMAGKVLGASALALVQVAGMMGPLLVIGFVVGVVGMIPALLPAISWYLLFLIAGFLLVSSLYAGVAATVSRQEEVGAATAPLMVLTMPGYILSFFAGSNETLMTVISYVPFTSPVAMPSRIGMGQAEWWEPFLSFALLVLTTIGCIALGARIYENSILRTGQRVRVIEALRRS